MKFFVFSVLLLLGCQERNIFPDELPEIKPDAENFKTLSFTKNSWQYFLQHLPTADELIVDYRGKVITNQSKHSAVITYDVGSEDLQQCADALMRIRAEYFYQKKQFSKIGFHFTCGGYYSFNSYCSGIRPVIKGNKISFAQIAPVCKTSHFYLRRYLNIVYRYANTQSLYAELSPADRFEVGTVIIYPGNPGHCCMIMDGAVSNKTDTVYKLVEGYMPAQSIYVLSNPYEPGLSPWYHLQKGTISTASCTFRSYFLRKFE